MHVHVQNSEDWSDEQAQVRERRLRQSVRAGGADVGPGPGALCVVRTSWTGTRMRFGLGLSAVRGHWHWQVGDLKDLRTVMPFALELSAVLDLHWQDGNLKDQRWYYQGHDSVARALSVAACTHVGELLCRD